MISRTLSRRRRARRVVDDQENVCAVLQECSEVRGLERVEYGVPERFHLIGGLDGIGNDDLLDVAVSQIYRVDPVTIRNLYFHRCPPFMGSFDEAHARVVSI